MRFFALLIGAILGFFGATLEVYACDLPAYAPQDHKNRFRMAEFAADVRVLGIRRTSAPYRRVASLQVVKPWKGVQKDQRLEVHFGDGSSCDAGFPKVGETINDLLIVRSQQGLASHLFFGIAGPDIPRQYDAETKKYLGEYAASGRALPAALALMNHHNDWDEYRKTIELYRSRRETESVLGTLHNALAEAYLSTGRLREAEAALAADSPADRTSGTHGLLQVKLEWVRLEKSGKPGGERRPQNYRLTEPFSLQDRVVAHIQLHGLEFQRQLQAQQSTWNSVRLSFSTLVEANFSRSRISNSDLRANFDRASFENADIRLSSFDYSDFQSARFDGVSASDSSFYRSRFDGAVLDHAAFNRAHLAGANFSGAKMHRVRLENSSLMEAKFQNANLTYSILDGSRATSADFSGADLTGASLKNTDLGRANFSGANLQSVDLTGAKISCHTVFPNGFRLPESVPLEVRQCLAR